MSKLTRILLIGFELLVLFQVLDMLTTVIAIEGAGLTEGNSLPRLVLQEMGWIGLAMLKIQSIFVGFLLFLAGLWMMPRVPIVLIPIITAILMADTAGLIVVVHNSIAILSTIH